MTRVVFAPRARAHVRSIEAWWRENRPAAPDLFANELVAALRLIEASPSIGAAYDYPGELDVRRVFLPKCRYHIYYSHDDVEDAVQIRAVWHSARGVGPELR